MADKILIYGPLMGGYDLAQELVNYQFLKLIGRARTQGLLYDLGGYPGAVNTDAAQSYVFGSLYEFTSEDTLQMIDESAGAVGEDPELYTFRRYRVPVYRVDGAVEQAWMFFYNMSVENCALIPSGDYVVHKAEEKKLSRRGFFSRLFPKP